MGLETLSTAFLYYPTDQDYMGCGVRSQPHTPSEELPLAARLRYFKCVSPYYDMHFVLPTLPSYYKLVIMSGRKVWAIQIKLQKILAPYTTMDDAVCISKLLKPLKKYHQQELEQLSNPFTTGTIKDWVRSLTTSLSLPLQPPRENDG